MPSRCPVKTPAGLSLAFKQRLSHTYIKLFTIQNYMYIILEGRGYLPQAAKVGRWWSNFVVYGRNCNCPCRFAWKRELIPNTNTIYECKSYLTVSIITPRINEMATFISKTYSVHIRLQHKIQSFKQSVVSFNWNHHFA